MPVIHIHLLHRSTQSNKEKDNRRPCKYLCLCLLNELIFVLSFSCSLPLPNPLSPQLCHPCFPTLLEDNSLHFCRFCSTSWLRAQPFFCNAKPSVNVPSFFLLSLPSCEIAVVSYGFLFLRDGRWVHVGVEATKHAVSAQRAGQHKQ